MEQSPYVLIDQKMLYSSLLQGLWFVIKSAWLPLLIIFALIVLKNIVEHKIEKRERLRKKQEEDAQWDARFERYLEKKKEHEIKK